MLKKIIIIPTNEKMIIIRMIMIKTVMTILTMITMMMMLSMMMVIMIMMMITMKRTMITLLIIYCIVFRLLKSNFFNNSMTKVKIGCFFSFNQKMKKSRNNSGTKSDFAFIFSLVTPVNTPGKVAKPTKRFAVMKFLSKLSPKCPNEWLGVV